MVSDMIVFTPGIWFAGFGLGFFIGFLVSLIKYIITAVHRWMKP
jgi:hypothetical protein